jgi:hypothetical protein
MVDGVATVIIISGLAVAAYSGLMALLDRPPDRGQLAGLLLVEAVLLVQAVLATGKMFTGVRPEAMATFVGYLLTAVLIPPVAALFGWTERTRWGSAIIAAGCLIVPILVLRLQQVWNA